MKFRYQKPVSVAVLLALLLTALGSVVAHADAPLPLITYRVTIHNLAGGQPLSPPVVATHRPGVRMFKVGRPAPAELEAIAEDGDNSAMLALLNGSIKVTEALNVGVPLTPQGKVVGDFSDSVSFEITARPGDRLSLATMLICTNDGFVGLDRGRLPLFGSRTFWLRGYDAGSEDNTENSVDIVDPCSALGPLPLSGDPNGNEDAAVDSDPAEVVQLHPGIQGVGDLSAAAHGWNDPVVKVTVMRIK
jgi:hypothetical protein